MRLLFTIDLKDYDSNMNVFVRPSARGIACKNGLLAMIHSKKYHYYKFPGGGIEKNETAIDALIRETQEESGLIVIPSSIKEYGYVHRIHKGKYEDVFIQDNFYFFMQCKEEIVKQQLETYEQDAEFELVFIDPLTAIDVNQNCDHGPSNPVMIERETRVLHLLMEEGKINGKNN